MDIRKLLENSEHRFYYGSESELQNYNNRVMEVAELLKKNPDNVVIGNPPKTTPKVPLPAIQKDPKQGGFIPGIIETPEFTYPEEKYYVPKAIYDAAVKFNEENDKAAAKSEEANRNQKRKNLLIAFTAKNGVVMGDDPRLSDLLDPNNPRLGTVGQAIKDFGAAPKVEGEEELGVLDAAKKQKILDNVIGFKKFQNETPSFKKQSSDIIKDITKPKQLDGQTFYNSYALNRHLKDKELQSITEKAAQEISRKYWLAGDISEFASKRISDEEAKNKKLNADIHNIVNGHKTVSVRDENYKYSKLTEDEKMLYNYFVMEQTSDMKTSLAGRYLKALELDLEQRAAVDIAEDMNGAEKGLYLFGHGVGGTLESIANIGGDFGYDPTEGEMLASAIIEGEDDGFAKFVYQSISTVSEQIPALAVGFASGGAGYSAVLSANIMSKSIKEAMQNNKTLIQGVSYGAVQASMELALERMLGGIGGKFLGKGSSGIVVKTLNKIDDIFTSRIPKALLKGAVVRLENGVGEFTQEFIQGITDPAIKNIIYQENNTYSLGTLNEALYQGLLGAVSGMFLGGGANAAQTTAYYETLGDTLSDSQVLDFAKEAGNVKSELYRELSEKARKGKELTAVERGMLSKETTDLVYSNSTFTKETLKFMATEGSVKQISDLLFDGNTEAAEAFKAKFSDSEYVDSLMFGENEAVDASFVEKALNPTAPETDATEAVAERQTAPTVEGIASEGAEALGAETEAATDSIAHPAPTAGKVFKMTPVSAKAKNYVKDIAKRLGTNLEFVDMAAELAKRGQNIEGLVIYPEGFYDPETHTLYVGNEVSNAVEFVFKHELTHYGERSKYYADFARAVRDSKAFKKWLDTQATYTAKDTAGKELQLHLILKERYEKVKNLTEPEAQREVVANFVADVLFKGDVETLSEILNEATPTRKNAVMRFLSDFFNWIKSKFTGSKQIVSEIADLENMFRELIGDAAVNPMPTESGITYDTATEFDSEMSVPEVQTDSSGKKLSKGQRNYFALSKVRDQYGRLLILYHGTANGKFYIFDRSKGNIENDFGRAHYFTTSRSDVAKNYEGGGPDFDAKVRRRAQELMNENGSLTFEQAEQKAHNELFKGSNMHTVYLLMVNPAVVGETNLLDPRIYLEQNNNDYAAAREQAEKDISKIALDLKYKLKIGNVNEITDLLWKVTNQGGIGIEQLKTEIGRLRLRDNDGNRLGNEVTRQIIESLGYDGIIDSTVSGKWNMDMEAGTTHYIVFNSEQIKSVDNKNPTKDTDVRYSVPAIDQAYLSAVERGDMETAQRMVDEAAKEAGYDYHLFHGTDADFTKFDLRKYGGKNGKGEGYGIYLAANREISAPYGKNVIDSYTKFNRLAEGDKKTLSYAEVKKIIKKSCELEAQRAVNDGEYDSITDAIKDTWVSNYVYTYEYSNMSQVYNEVANILWKNNDNDGEIINEMMASSGAHYDYENALNFYDNVLTPTTGIDGFHYIWGSKDGNGVQNDIYLAFSSEQIKSADPVTYDDNGNVIPLSERFNSSNPDIRFSVPASEGKAQNAAAKSLLDRYNSGEISYEEMVQQIEKGWSEAGKTYGVKPDGEMVTANNKPANVPNKVAPGKTVRRFVRNVLEANYSKDFNNALKSETLAKNKGTVYEVQSNKDLAKKARDKISRMSIGRAQENWLKDTDRINPEKIAIGESLLVMAEQEGRIEDGVQLASELAIMFTTAGQVVQAARLFKRLGSIGKLIYLQKMVNKLNRDIARRYKNADPLVLNETLAAQLLETKTEEEAEVVLDAIKAELGQQMPSNWLDKWNAWRYMSMLVNPTTHIRNFTGNLLFKPAIAMSEALSATIQSGVGAVQRARGKEFEKTTTFKANKRDKDFAAKDWAKNRKKVMSSGKYEDVSEIEDNRVIYKNGILEGIRKGNSNLLEWEDGIFLKNHYIRTLARYLTANKINPETASEAQLDRARKYAIKKAQEYTYRDASKVANWLSKTAKDFKGADFFINGIIPFKKTPINVLKRGIEYSPLGFIKSLVDYGTKVRKGDMTVGEFIDGLASATTGTGLFILGALLSNLGVLKGDFDDDDKWFEKLRGHQEYSIELFGVSYTINWAAPSSVPMFMGAAFSSFQSDEDGNWLDNLLSMGTSGLEPVLELTMLQGINDALDAVSYADDNEKLWTLGGNILTSYATQGLPTIGGKIANVIDDKRRTKYIDPSKGSVTLQTMWDTFSKKVPFLSKTRAEYIDAWGREQYTGNVIERFFAQFVSPGYASTIDPDPIYDELKAIKESTGEAGVYPETPRKYITVSGDRRDLTKEEYYNIATMSGQTKMNLVNEAMDHKFYDKLTDEQKAEVIMNIYKYANKLAVVSELDFTLDEIKAGLGDKKGSVLTESRWNGFSFEQQQYLIHEAFMDGVITAYKYEQNGGSAAEYFILKALKNN